MIRQICLFGIGMTLCLSCCFSPLHAQTIIDGVPTDSSVQSSTPGPRGGGDNARLNLNGQLIRVGHWNGSNGNLQRNVAGVFVFELPDLGPVTDPFATATFDFVLTGLDTTGAAPTYNVDLFGLGRRASNSVIASADYYVGPAGPAQIGPLLQDNILTPTSATVVSSVDIADFLNEQYAGGDGVKQFISLLLSPDFNPNAPIPMTRDAYLIASANNDSMGLRPLINFSTTNQTVLRGDVNLDMTVDFSDIAPFIERLANNEFQAEADVDGSGEVNFDDIAPFIEILAGP